MLIILQQRNSANKEQTSRQRGRTRIIEVFQFIPAGQSEVGWQLIPQLLLAGMEKLLRRISTETTKARSEL